ncbi:hypothetical protein TNCV_3111161 [Trichonephila clavipes]|nr:hypothetical protein TNCV_3111161 [Trichonephila clavipes]
MHDKEKEQNARQGEKEQNARQGEKEQNARQGEKEQNARQGAKEYTMNSKNATNSNREYDKFNIEKNTHLVYYLKRFLYISGIFILIILKTFMTALLELKNHKRLQGGSLTENAIEMFSSGRVKRLLVPSFTFPVGLCISLELVQITDLPGSEPFAFFAK